MLWYPCLSCSRKIRAPLHYIHPHGIAYNLTAIYPLLVADLIHLRQKLAADIHHDALFVCHDHSPLDTTTYPHYSLPSWDRQQW